MERITGATEDSNRSSAAQHSRDKPENYDEEEDECEIVFQGAEPTLPLHILSEINTHYTCEEFVTKLWQLAESDFGYDTCVMEGGSLIRTGNHVLETKSQTQAMYGRIKPVALERVFQIMDLQPTDIFIDLGHGIGNASLQAAYTRGCEARGIEIMQDRCFIADRFKERLAEIKHLLHEERDGDHRSVGLVNFVEGDFTLRCHKTFVTEDGRRVVKAFVNNAHSVFGYRSAKIGMPQLDEYCAALFASMCPGSVMVTVDPLICLGRSLTEENDYRVKSLNLESHMDASYFEYNQYSIGDHAVSWGDSEIFVHVYKRVEQSNEEGESRFICAYKDCIACTNGNATVALEYDEKHTDKIATLNYKCVFCHRNRLPPRRNRTRSSSYRNSDSDCDSVSQEKKRKKSKNWKHSK